jgi:hypothetical protein
MPVRRARGDLLYLAIKTTYEFSSNLEAIAELQQLLHALRERFQ